MMYKLIVQEEAGLEILETYIYYESMQTGLGEKFLMQVEKYFLQIQNNPKHFQIKGSKYREAYLRKFPYIIIFDMVDDRVIILSVFNAHQNPERKP
ncbi:type II toxin-antitoxin system RelE/ParE family toxin [uncultured Chryseobacterium sp.]|uniref:type II toxin-antitoxin system RelE/ParE family toxin n=1 Tax=uncultured Chryseobacterium sp. TaxID=259322 RepID=UPI0025ED5731|nr:type II toxin-antitoxin system RelE/ParE family toxin [uncultured Chryseobacterium sp.]